jgi:PAS domain S-box-containing protein
MKASPLRTQARALMPILVLAAGLALTAVLTAYTMHAERVKSRAHFNSAVDETAQSIEACVLHHITLLRAGSLFFSANRWIDPAAQLKAYASVVELRQAYPGVQALELCLHLTTAEKKALDLDRGPTRLKIWPDSLRSDYFVIAAVEPMDDRNRMALGFDLFTQPALRDTMVQACESGAPLASGRVILAQETDRNKQTGFIIFSPLYPGSQIPPPAQRKQEIRGFLCCAFRMGDLIANAVDPKALLPLGMKVFDSQELTAQHLLFSSVDPARADEPRFKTSKTLTIAERPLTIVFSSRPEFESTSMREFVVIIPILGFLFSSLFFVYLRAGESARARAEAHSAMLAQSESLLKESDQRHRVLVDSAPVIIWESNAEGQCTFVNQTGLAFAGCARDKILGDQWHFLFQPGDLRRFTRTAILARHRQREFKLKCRLSRKDGQMRCLWFSATPLLRSEDRQFRGFIGSCVDATEQENAQEWLRASEELYRIIAETAADGVITMDSKGVILSANEIIGQIFGSPPAEVIGKRADVLVPELFDQKQPCADLLSLAQSGASCKNVLLNGKHRDGSEISLEISLGSGQKQGAPFIIAILRDISERKKIQKSMYHVQKMQAIGSLASGIAHDFNNVFTAVLSHLDLAIHSGEDTENRARALEHLEYVKTSASRGAELVKRLLAFSRQTVPQTQSFNPAELIRETVALLQRGITRRIQITAEFTPGVWPAKGDDSQIKQVVINLCLNARDAMPDGGSMVVSAVNHTVGPDAVVPPRRAGEFVRVTVSDTGAGMTKQVLDRLFEPYFTTKEFGQAAGLGLSIANNIVTGVGGWIEVESKVNHGSRFHVFLPRAAATAEITASISSVAKHRSSLDGTESILIADDDYMIRNLMRAVLAYRGYKVTEVADGQDAIERALSATDPIDLVLMDVEMPRVDGWAALAQIRAQKPALPVILCSGSSSEQFDAEAKAAGAASVLPKPFTNPELLKTVREVLDTAKPPAQT